MKRIIFFVISAAFILSVVSCGGADLSHDTDDTAIASVTTDDTAETTSPISGDGTDKQEYPASVTVRIGEKTFKAELEDNDTARSLIAMLPMTLEMKELNNNEKYYYFDVSLPASPRYFGGINEGDIMLYGDNCLVLFYETFQTVYSYTRIGHIENVSEFKDALGGENVTVTFEP